MDREQILNMDSYILLSLINMKLRDEFPNIKDFCSEFNISEEDLNNKLRAIRYIYNEKNNQYVSIEA
ncbi:MAG: DUF4250 domain-containing protein [Clostridium sp.]|nr:DUF4250 domain-containing protein [Clostridium sp.]